MFNVGRFDPKKESNKIGNEGVDNPHPRNTDDMRKSTKRRRSKDEGVSKIIFERAVETKPYIVAPEAKGPVSNTSKRGRIQDEAFDDMELEDTETEGNKDHPATIQPQSGPNDHDVSDPSPEEIRNAIHMSSLPIQDAAKEWNLAPFLVKNLEQEGYENFFPIQALVIPDIIASERYSYIRAQGTVLSSDKCCANDLPYCQSSHMILLLPLIVRYLCGSPYWLWENSGIRDTDSEFSCWKKSKKTSCSSCASKQGFRYIFSYQSFTERL